MSQKDDNFTLQQRAKNKSPSAFPPLLPLIQNGETADQDRGARLVFLLCPHPESSRKICLELIVRAARLGEEGEIVLVLKTTPRLMRHGSVSVGMTKLALPVAQYHSPNVQTGKLSGSL